MSRGSLKASSNGIKRAKQALIRKGLTQKSLAEDELEVARSTVSRFFGNQPVDRTVFQDICRVLDLDWKDIFDSLILEELDTIQSADLVGFENLAQEIRQQIRRSIQERCGTMRVLDMTQPISLTGEQGIYTDVHILEKILSRRRVGVSELLQSKDLEEFDRSELSRITEKRVPGLEAVSRFSKLMVLGKPGAGKTTFLKYLTMLCSEGQARGKQFLADCVPVFVTLKDFAEVTQQLELLDYIAQQLTIYGVTDARNKTERLLNQNRFFILLDGLDEVREADASRVLREIDSFAQQFHDNHFVITCRIAAREYTFQNFTEAEIADFDDVQIRSFIRNWFLCKNPATAQQSADRMIYKMEVSHPIKELANNPLLLTLLCLEFEESMDFPANRADLYNRGLKVLLSKWDASRRIERDQVYERLPLKRKEDLLSKIALITFQQKDYFFKQSTLEGYIADYIRNLPDAHNDPVALLLDSEAILKSIEAQHGLLVERARGIYSFSHLTFQEYFTAKSIVTSPDPQSLEKKLQNLSNHITETRWREIFLLTVGMLPSADYFLQLIKRQVDSLLVDDETLQQLLTLIHQKTISVETSFKLAILRAFCLFIVIAHTSVGLNLERTRDSVLAFALDLDHTLALDHTFNIAFALDRIPDSIHDLDRVRDINLDRTRAFIHVLGGLCTRLHSPQFKQELQLLKDGLPDPDGDKQTFKSWWQANGLSWREQLRVTMLHNCNIEHRDWHFSEEQIHQLELYLTANRLLVNCLNSECYVSRSVRDEVEITLLLPCSPKSDG